jgi:hypothetical protein
VPGPLVEQDATKKKKPMVTISGRGDFFLKRVFFLKKYGCGIIILSSDEKLMVHNRLFYLFITA